MITIVRFRIFDKEVDKVFYEGETIQQIHKALSEINDTYIPLSVIVCAAAPSQSLFQQLYELAEKPF